MLTRAREAALELGLGLALGFACPRAAVAFRRHGRARRIVAWKVTDTWLGLGLGLGLGLVGLGWG